MKILKLHIKGYKNLKDTLVDFRTINEKEYANLHFLVGINGSGKSSFLEAAGLIFTRIMQDESPGFYFDLEYQIENTLVKVRHTENSESRQSLSVELYANDRSNSYSAIPEQYKPKRIISYTSGANSNMFDIMMTSTKDSLASDLYDEIFSPDKKTPDNIDDVLTHYDRLINHNRILSLSSENSSVLLPVLFAMLPGYSLKEIQRYSDLRAELTKIIPGFLPSAFSIVVNEEKLNDIAEEGQEHHKRLKALLAGNDKGENCYDWQIRRSILEENQNNPLNELVTGFLFQVHPETGTCYHKQLNNAYYSDPMLLLYIFQNCYESGAIREMNFSFNTADCPHLLSSQALSDGELLWLARMGLILLSQTDSSANTLFLLDEPDVHFNDDWNVNFVSLVYKLCANYKHALIVATHSTLILTDAHCGQIHLFSKTSETGIVIKQISTPAFGAQREEIAKHLFDAASIGTYASEIIEQLLEKAQSSEELREWILKSGPGYQRFRLFERYYELTELEHN